MTKNPRYFYYDTSAGKFRLKMQFVNFEHGKNKFKYEFISPDKKVLFAGDDFYMPCYDYLNHKAANALMGFLTLRIGDTDREYFDNYTEDQLAFCNSFVCEELQSMLDYD